MNIRIFKIKENKLNEWLSWCEELQTEKVKKLIAKENIDEIGNFLFELDNKKYVIYYVRTKGKKVDYGHSFNKKHYAKKRECLLPLSDPEQLFIIKRYEQQK